MEAPAFMPGRMFTKRKECGVHREGKKSRHGAGFWVGYVSQTALLLLIAQDQQGTTQQDHDCGDGNVDKDE